jgi:hypothetical protein
MQEIENPDYASWAPFKPGSSVTLRTESRRVPPEDGVERVVMEDTLTLELLDVSAATIECAGWREIDGKREELPKRTLTIQARIAGPAPGQPPSSPQFRIETGEEELEVAGRRLTCRTRASQWIQSNPSGSGHSKAWFSTEIPGGVARSEQSADVDGRRSSDVAVVVAWQAKT